MDRPGARLVYGYEEAIGYCVDPDAVPDKDGITALARLLDTCRRPQGGRRALADRLDEIARRYGVYETDQLSVRVDDSKIIAAAMAGFVPIHRQRSPASRFR